MTSSTFSRQYAPLAERGVVALRGPETRPFLQGLISNDLERVTPGRAIYAALLTPQGKYLFDFFVLQDGDDLLLDAERERLPQLMQRLMMYRLRSKVEIEDASERYGIAAVFGDDPLAALDLPPEAGACRPCDGGLLYVDPRLAALGARALLPPERLAGTFEGAGFVRAEPDDYARLCLLLGVPDGARDLAVEKATLLESGFEELNGVDFKKGCFVGQELTARMKYRGLVRKRLMPVSFNGPPPEPGTVVRLDGRDAGEIRSARDGRGLALMRLEQVAKASEQGVPLVAGETEVIPHKPEWANF